MGNDGKLQPSEMKVAELRATVDQQNDTIKALQRSVKTLTDTLDKSEAIHRGELRGRLLKRIHEDTVLTSEDVMNMTCADMQDILTKIPLIKRKEFHSVSDAGGAFDEKPVAAIDSAFLFGPDAKYKSR